MIFVECPACEDQFRIPVHQLGRSQICPACDRSFKPQTAVTALRQNSELDEIGQISETVSRSLEPATTKFRKDVSKRTHDQEPYTQAEAPRTSPDSEIGSDYRKGISLPRIPLPLGAAGQSPRVQSHPDLVVFQGSEPQSFTGRINGRNRHSPMITGVVSLVGLVATLGVLFIAIHVVSSRLSEQEADRDHLALNSETLEKAALSTDTHRSLDDQTITERSSGLGGLQQGDSPERVARVHNSRKDGNSRVDIKKDQNDQDKTWATKPKPEEFPQTYTMAHFSALWDKLNSYVVRLDITTPTGTRQASGLIIDSRGWVATSASAIENAMEVKVILASRSFDKGTPWREHSDLSRGVIARDRVRDLAIISINRDLVLNFTEVEFDTDFTIVTGQRLIVARTPPSGRRLWLYESRVDHRTRIGNLMDDLEFNVDAASGRNVDPDERWIVNSHRTEDTFCGAPILNDKGQVVALNTSFALNTPNDNSYLVPIIHLIELKKRVGDTVTAFGISNPAIFGRDAAEEMAKSAANAASPGKVADGGVAVSRFAEINDLRESFQVCQAFEFVGRDVEEIDQVGQFVERLKIAIDYSVDASISWEDRENLTEEIDQLLELTKSVISRFGGELTRRIKDMNEMMLLDFDERKPIPVGLICTVESGAATSPRYLDKETVTLRANGAAMLFFVTLSDDSIVLPPGKTFMLFGYTDPRNQLSRRGGTPPLIKLDLLFGCEVKAYGGQ